MIASTACKRREAASFGGERGKGKSRFRLLLGVDRCRLGKLNNGDGDGKGDEEDEQEKATKKTYLQALIERFRVHLHGRGLGDFGARRWGG